MQEIHDKFRDCTKFGMSRALCTWGVHGGGTGNVSETQF